MMHRREWDRDILVTPRCDARAKEFNSRPFLPRDAMHKRGLCRHAVFVCPSVCVSVTFVDHVKMYKHIFEFFHLRVATPF